VNLVHSTFSPHVPDPDFLPKDSELHVFLDLNDAVDVAAAFASLAKPLNAQAGSVEA
jgi:hypothetical protein